MKSTLWKKIRLRNSHLYLILDKDTCRKRNILNIAKKSLEAGVDIIQFRFSDTERLKNLLRVAEDLKEITVSYGKIFIINNRVDLAWATGADGVHLGRDDMPIDLARKMLRHNKIIGLSCHSIAQIKEAIKKKIDYISVGPIFRTSTKPEYHPVGIRLIQEINKNIKIPFFAIGGINKFNIEKVTTSGAKRIAVCRAICQAEDIFRATKELKWKLL